MFLFFFRTQTPNLAHVATSQSWGVAPSYTLRPQFTGERFYYTLPRGAAVVLRDDSPNKGTEDKKSKDDKISKVEQAVRTKLAQDSDDYVEELLPPPVKKPVVDRIKDGLHHYWVGTKLLYADTKISLRILRQVVSGKELTRREKKQLRLTTSDMFRLVPFLVIVVVPFAEFALPFLLHFFPNMLPSTFEDKYEKQEKTKKVLKARLETAKFLQTALEDMALESKDPQKSKTSESYTEFFRKVCFSPCCSREPRSQAYSSLDPDLW